MALSIGQVIMGRFVWGELSIGKIVREVSCPLFKLSMGLVVHEASYHGASCPEIRRRVERRPG
jgi:hypothetical protein